MLNSCVEAIYSLKHRFISILFTMLLFISFILGVYYMTLYERTTKILSEDAEYTQDSITSYLKESIKKKNAIVNNFYASSNSTDILERDGIVYNNINEMNSMDLANNK